MQRFFRFSLLAIALFSLAGDAGAGDTRGWQGMRVILQEGNPRRMLAADIDGDGREELIVVNTRQSRLDVFRWLTPAERGAAPAADPDRPNELPLAPEWKRTEIALEDLPHEMVLEDLDGDGELEWLQFSGTNNKVLLSHRQPDGTLKKERSWDLLPGVLSGREPMIVRRTGEGRPQALLSFEQGIQVLDLEPGSRPAWIQPRESRGRNAWRLADLDGDGDEDLVEWTSQSKQTVRWYAHVFGEFQPPQVLYEQGVAGCRFFEPLGKPTELMFLGGAQEGVLRRCQLGRGVKTPVGTQFGLPLSGGTKALWAGVRLGERRCLVAVDPAQPRVRVHALSTDGWMREESYPIVNNVKGIAAPAAADGTVLFWVRDARDLHESHWDGARLSYPEPKSFGADAENRKILAFDSIAGTVWWAQRSGEDLDLYVWDRARSAPERMRFTAFGAKVDRVRWLGGKRVLLFREYETTPVIASIDEAGTVTKSEPSHLAKVDPNEFRLYRHGDALRLARLTDGVVQWIGDDNEPKDQVMLSDGGRIAAYVPVEEGAWTLEQGGGFVHRMRPDAAGIPRVSASHKLPGGVDLIDDPALGLMLVDQERVVHLAEGEPHELKLIDSVDGRVGRPSGVKEATIHRFFVGEYTGDRQDDVIVCDDRRHELSLLTLQDGALKPMMTWQVFEDLSYPYGGNDGEELVAEPRAIIGFNADGDPQRDLALLCHDRLLVYLGREESK